jgi:two-component system chemotaxis sensor kinase CheA
MRFLEPVVTAIGHLPFRNKLRVTATIFGIPLLILAGMQFHALDSRVDVLQKERAALTIQIPATALLAEVHLLIAAQTGMRDGAGELEGQARDHQAAARAAMEGLRSALAVQGIITTDSLRDAKVIGRWDQVSATLGSNDTEKLAEIASHLAAEIDKLNEHHGLLNDGDASSSRMLAVLTGQYPELIKSAGLSARLGVSTLTKKSLRGSKRNELTLLRGNFDSLVQWSMTTLQKVGRDNATLTASLDDTGSTLNNIFLPIQEAITTKMLETADYDMTPETFLAMSETAFRDSLLIGTRLAQNTDLLLADRMGTLTMQRNIIVAAMIVALTLIFASFFAAYISIMRGLNGLSDAVNTMAAGNLDARAEVTSKDELGDVATRFNQMAQSLAERTAQLHETTAHIHAMLHNLPQGILTIDTDGRIHKDYSSFLETILATDDIAGHPATDFLFAGCSLGVDAQAQISATLDACIGEDRMNFDMNAHLLIGEMEKTLNDGRKRILDLTWAPICDENDTVEKVMVCLRDVTELRQLEVEAAHQKRELELIGQILAINQEKFHDFIDSAKNLAAENDAVLQAPVQNREELVNQLFRNMHTIKGNARTYGFQHLTNAAHEAEQAYDELRKDRHAPLNPAALRAQLQTVSERIDDYARLNDVKLGRKGPGRRGSAEKYHMVPHARIEQMLGELDSFDVRAAHHDTLAAILQQVKLDLRLIGADPLREVLAGVFESLPSLAHELHKEAPLLVVNDHGIHIRNQVNDLLRNVFMHLYRNAMDHGLETAAERIAQGKRAQGTITLDAHIADGRLNLHLYDDGRGLALGHIRRTASERGVIDAGAVLPDEEIASLIFAAGFSTAAAVTEVSGRGVGMDAVRGFLTREGGDIRLAFRDQASGAGFRAFETILSIPARFAVDASAAQTHAELSARAKFTAESARHLAPHAASPRRHEPLPPLHGELAAI